MQIFRLTVPFMLAALPLGCSSDTNPIKDGGSGGGAAEGSGGALSSSTGGLENGDPTGTGGVGIGGTGGLANTTGGAGPAGGSAPTGGGSGTFTTSIVIEEDDAAFCAVDGVVESSNAGFSGTGYANADNAVGAAIEWAVQIGEAGIYSLEFTYANASGDRVADVLIDGDSAVSALSFPATTDWTTWSTITAELTLAAGEHHIVLAAASAEGLANIDKMTVSGSAINALNCSDAGGTDGAGGTATGGSDGNGTGGAPGGPITIWIAGDSTVANGNTPCPAGWGKHFEPYFNDDVTVVNSAVGGRSIQTWLYEGNVSSTLGGDKECILTSESYNSRWTNMLDGMKAGDYLFIQFGINDGDSTCPRHVGGALYKEYLGAMASAAKERGATPIFMTPTAAIQCSGNTAVGNRGFLTETKAAATEHGATLIDINTLSVKLYNSAGLCPNSDVYTGSDAVGKFFCDDHTHFDNPGAIQIAGAVAQAVADQGLPLATHLLK